MHIFPIEVGATPGGTPNTQYNLKPKDQPKANTETKVSVWSSYDNNAPQNGSSSSIDYNEAKSNSLFTAAKKLDVNGYTSKLANQANLSNEAHAEIKSSTNFDVQGKITELLQRFNHSYSSTEITYTDESKKDQLMSAAQKPIDADIRQAAITAANQANADALEAYKAALDEQFNALKSTDGSKVKTELDAQAPPERTDDANPDVAEVNDAEANADPNAPEVSGSKDQVGDKTTVYSSFDKKPADGKINFQEAKEGNLLGDTKTMINNLKGLKPSYANDQADMKAILKQVNFNVADAFNNALSQLNSEIGTIEIEGKSDGDSPKTISGADIDAKTNELNRKASQQVKQDIDSINNSVRDTYQAKLDKAMDSVTLGTPVETDAPPTNDAPKDTPTNTPANTPQNTNNNQNVTLAGNIANAVTNAVTTSLGLESPSANSNKNSILNNNNNISSTPVDNTTSSPTDSSYTTYTVTQSDVSEGSTLESFAQAHNTTVAELKAANPNDSRIQSGNLPDKNSQIKLPKK